MPKRKGDEIQPEIKLINLESGSENKVFPFLCSAKAPNIKYFGRAPGANISVLKSNIK